GQVPRVLGHLRLTRLPLLLELLEVGDDHRQQLDDDARGDVRHDADREDRQLQQSATGEEVDQGVQLGVLACHRRVEESPELGVVDARRRDLCADPVEDDDPEGEEDLLPQIPVLDRGRECGEHMSSWSWTTLGRHVRRKQMGCRDRSGHVGPGPGTHNRENSIKIRAGAGSETLGHDPCSSPHGPMTVRSGNQAPASVTLPPAASILLLADADTLSTATVTATERSPSPSTLTGWPLRTAPADTSSDTPTSPPCGNSRSMSDTLTTWNTTLFRFLKPLSFGSRIWS